MKEIPLFLAEASMYCELALQESWSMIPKERPFPLHAGGKSFRVISRGTWNHDAGPDFLNAKIEIDGQIRTGDVEIHCKTSQWAAHGHHGDPMYQNVILHAVGMNDLSPANAPKLPMIPLFILPRDYDQTELRMPQQKDGLCADLFARMPDSAIHKFVSDAGLERLRAKSEKLLEDMIAKGTKDALVIRLFEQIGIPGNRAQFKQLAQRLLTYDKEIREQHIQAILWGESGCLPDPAKTQLSGEAAPLVNELWNQWWQIRRVHYDPIRFSHRSRPLNSISRRIAILSEFIRNFSENPLPVMLDVIRENSVDDAIKIFISKLNITDPFWKKHTSFTSNELKNPAVLLGNDRIIELLVDVMIPAVHAYSSVAGEFKLTAKVESLFLAMPKTGSNKTLREIIQRCFPGKEAIFRTAAAQQGLIHIQKTWCEKLACNCKACPICQLV